MQWTTKGMTVMFHVKALWSHLNSSRQLWTHFVPILGCFCHGFVMTSHSSSYQTRPLTSSFPELPLALRPTAGAAHRQHKRRPGTQHAHTSVGRKQLTRLLRHSAVLLFITCLTPDAFLFVASAHFRPLRSCCIHSNFFYRLTMNHFFVWIFFLILRRSLSIGLVSASSVHMLLDWAHSVLLVSFLWEIIKEKDVDEKGSAWFGGLVFTACHLSLKKSEILA